jgi:hypothetical protein
MGVSFREGIMTRHTGGDKVPGGFYFDTRQWHLEAIEGAAGALPGDGRNHYVKVPAAAMLVAAPLMGLAFVIVLPFIGLFVVAEQISKKAATATRTVREHWRPGSITLPRR